MTRICALESCGNPLPPSNKLFCCQACAWLGQRRCSEEQARRIVAACEAGATLTAAAKAEGVKPDNASDTIRKLGLQPAKVSKVDFVFAYLDQHPDATNQEIANAVGLTTTFVRHARDGLYGQRPRNGAATADSAPWVNIKPTWEDASQKQIREYLRAGPLEREKFEPWVREAALRDLARRQGAAA